MLRTIFYSFLFFVLTITMFSCKKNEGDYYNYTNNNSTYNGSLYDYLKSSNNFDSMVLLLEKVNLLDTLATTDSLTVFAFDNICFINAMTNLNILRIAQNRPVLTLRTLDSGAVNSLITKYILPQYLPVDSIKTFPDGKPVPTVRFPNYLMNVQYAKSNAEGFVGGGPQFISYSDRNNSEYASFWVTNRTKSVNIRTTNGIIHLLEDGHEFGFSKATTILNK